MKYAITDLLTGIALERAERAEKVQAQLDEETAEHFAKLAESAPVRESLAELLHSIADDITAAREPYTVIYSDASGQISHEAAKLTGKLYSKYNAERAQRQIEALQERLDAIHAEHGEVGSPLECFLEASRFSGEIQVSGAVLTAHGFDVKRVPLYLRAAAQSRVGSTDA